MNATELNEAMGITNSTIIAGLLKLIEGQSGAQGAQLRYQCGVLSVNGNMWLSETTDGIFTFWTSLAKCFDIAQSISSVTFELLEQFRKDMVAVSAKSLPAIAVRNFGVRMALAEQSKILAAKTFSSRREIDNYFNTINAAFEVAELVAADNKDNVAYVALIKLHAAVSNDLANRARPLPKMVTYAFARSRPSLAIAQSLYQDPSRSDELIAENSPIHPLFMPATGTALSK